MAAWCSWTECRETQYYKRTAHSTAQVTRQITTKLSTQKAPWVFHLERGKMDLEEPSEKVDAFTRGPKECKTVSGVSKPGRKC